MKKSVIVNGIRTAVGSLGGSLSEISAVRLGSKVIKESIKQAGIKKEEVTEVIMGNVIQAGLGQNPARQAALGAGLPYEISCLTVNKVCGSGLISVILAEQMIALDKADVIIAGGMENMSQAPYLKARSGYRLGDGVLSDSIMTDGLVDAYKKYPMGLTAEILAEKYKITREEQDRYAAYSQQRAEKAIRAGRFKEEIVPVEIFKPKAEPIIFQQDEFPRFGTKVEKLATLKPAFKENGTVTAGNSSGINDAAAAVLLMSEQKALSLGLKPLGRIIGYATVGLDPEFMGLGPVMATRKILKDSRLKLEDIDLVEVNEAFAAQILSVEKELGWNREIVNVNGGAIALGHPIGASGTRILVTLLYEMKRRQAHYGLSTLCVGGGEGVAILIEGVPL